MPDTQKKGSAETTLPHGLDESYNHLSRDILFCVCCLATFYSAYAVL